MDNCRMNRNFCRPASPGGLSNTRCQTCRPGPGSRGSDAFACLDEHFPTAMGYVPFQKWSETFDLCKGLQMGTIFPELCKPFCGKGGAPCR